MIKKSIISVLIILIFIQSFGCYTYSQIEKENTKEIEVVDEFKITILEGTVYYLTDVEFQEFIVRGKEMVIKENLRYPDRIVEIRFEDIKSIEIDEFDGVKTLVVVMGIIFTSYIVLVLIIAASLN